jgi:hypothetical protein
MRLHGSPLCGFEAWRLNRPFSFTEGRDRKSREAAKPQRGNGWRVASGKLPPRWGSDPWAGETRADARVYHLSRLRRWGMMRIQIFLIHIPSPSPSSSSSSSSSSSHCARCDHGMLVVSTSGPVDGARVIALPFAALRLGGLFGLFPSRKDGTGKAAKPRSLKGEAGDGELQGFRRPAGAPALGPGETRADARVYRLTRLRRWGTGRQLPGGGRALGPEAGDAEDEGEETYPASPRPEC